MYRIVVSPERSSSDPDFDISDPARPVHWDRKEVSSDEEGERFLEDRPDTGRLGYSGDMNPNWSSSVSSGGEELEALLDEFEGIGGGLFDDEAQEVPFSSLRREQSMVFPFPGLPPTSAFTPTDPSHSLPVLDIPAPGGDSSFPPAVPQVAAGGAAFLLPGIPRPLFMGAVPPPTSLLPSSGPPTGTQPPPAAAFLPPTATQTAP